MNYIVICVSPVIGPCPAIGVHGQPSCVLPKASPSWCERGTSLEVPGTTTLQLLHTLRGLLRGLLLVSAGLLLLCELLLLTNVLQRGILFL